MKQNPGKAFNFEETFEIPRSSLHTIMHKTSNQAVLPEDAVLPEEVIVQTGNGINSDKHITINQTVLSEEVALPQELIVQTGNEIKSEMNNNLVRQIQIHEDFVASNQKTTGETQSSNQKKEVPPVSSHLISENSQEAEISSGDSAKNLFAGSTISKEQLKANESLQIVENIKVHEGSQTKASINDMEEFTAEAKSKVSDGLQISEKDKSASEFQSLIRPKSPDVSKLTERFKLTEDLQGHAKVKVSEDFLAKEIFKSPD